MAKKNREKSTISTDMSISEKTYLMSIEHEKWGMTCAEKETLFARRAIAFDLNSIDRVYDGSINFISLEPIDRKFLIMAIGVSSLEQLDAKLQTMPDGAIKDRAIRLLEQLM